MNRSAAEYIGCRGSGRSSILPHIAPSRWIVRSGRHRPVAANRDENRQVDDITGADMRAWVVSQPGPIATQPLRMIRRHRTEPAAGELLVRIIASGVCRTDLHLAEGDLPPHRPDMVPGHEIVGEVVQMAPDV